MNARLAGPTDNNPTLSRLPNRRRPLTAAPNRRWGRAATYATLTTLAFAACSRPESSAAQASSGQQGTTRQEAARALREELTPIVRDELREELRPQVLAELRNELQRPRPPGPASRPNNPGAPDAGSTASSPHSPDAVDSPPRNGPDAGNADLWTTPGSTIWPSAGGLRLVEVVVGTELEEKLPVGIQTHYPNIPELFYCYTVFDNPLSDQTVTHIWRRSGRLVSKVELEVGTSPKWRTWSKQKTQPHWNGVWSCEVLSSDGTQLGLTVFQVGG